MVLKKASLLVVTLILSSLIFPNYAFALQADEIKNTKDYDYLLTDLKSNGVYTTTVSYYENGLIKKASKDGSNYRYYYDKNNRIKKFVITENGNDTSYRYSYDNGKLSKCIISSELSTSKMVYKLNKNNKISKAILYINMYGDSYMEYSTVTYKYDKYGYISRMISKKSDSFTQFSSSNTDLRLNTNIYGLVLRHKQVGGSNGDWTSKYKYKLNGRYPISVTEINNTRDGNETAEFNYEKISKSSGMSKKHIEKQQEYILNRDFVSTAISAYL